MRTVIFGTGGVGEKCLTLLRDAGHSIVGFADNDPQKWGKYKEGLPIFQPALLPGLAIDMVAIGIFKAAGRVQRQLEALGFAPERIIIPIQPDRVFLNTRYADDSGLPEPAAENDSKTTRAFLAYRKDLEDQIFLDRLEALKTSCKEYNIPLTEICIVSGGVLQAYGLRSSALFDDIDIIMTERFRQQYGRGLVIVSESVEVHPQNEYRIDDDTIITKPEWHFVWQGLKFARLSLLYEQPGRDRERPLMEEIMQKAGDSAQFL